MGASSPRQFVADLLPKLRSERVTYFPIRHHSPACAAHLHRWIDTHRPAAVLVEGPASFSARIDLLVDERCACPVALYTTFIDKRGRLHAGDAEGDAERLDPFGPPRFAAYYPFCDYSPELVALRAGRAVGARLRFIDLEYPEMILARHAGGAEQERDAVRVDSLAADPHLRHSAYVQELARRLGCRDFNELWDHLFEACWDTLDTDAFLDRLATWCAMARLEYTLESLRQDGTTAREACMAALIGEELDRAADSQAGPVLVVTGGFHTVALPDLVARREPRPKPPALGEDEVGTWLMRYSFDQLDALAGYASGMPSPAFYDRLWKESPAEARHEEATPRRTEAVADLIVEIGRLTRARGLATAATTPDAIAALQMTRQLAALRGHAWPLREDVLDGMRSCYIKGEVGVEGQALVRLVLDVLAGNRVGQVPPDAGAPPIVADFDREARRLRLPVESVERREMALDLYRNVTHRQVSRFFHRLDLLGAPFAGFVSGPDFVTGQGLELMQEHWRVCWSPATESALIEASVFGATVEEAAGARLRQQIARLQDEGEGRNAAAAVTLLIRACRLGLHRQAGELVPLIEAHVAEDPSFASVVNGLSQLELLDRSREPLEAAHLTAVPRLLTAAYQRACRLADDLATCPDEAVDSVVGALRTLREVLAAARAQEGEQSPLDPALFHQALGRVVSHTPSRAQSPVVGAAAGILYGDGVLAEAGLIELTRGYLGGTTDPRKSCGLLRGLLATAREIAWQVTEVTRALDAQLCAWEEQQFLAALPELRLAFTDLTPREVARVADHVAGLHDEQSLGELVHVDLDETEVRLALEVTRIVRDSLKADGLSGGSSHG